MDSTDPHPCRLLQYKDWESTSRMSRIIIILFRIHHDTLYFRDTVESDKRYHQLSILDNHVPQLTHDLGGEWGHTAYEERPQWSENGSVIIPQPSQSLGEPSIGSTIIIHVPSGYTKVSTN
jgi:hypothetical protein